MFEETGRQTCEIWSSLESSATVYRTESHSEDDRAIGTRHT
jgi:hypothetical protein